MSVCQCKARCVFEIFASFVCVLTPSVRSHRSIDYIVCARIVRTVVRSQVFIGMAFLTGCWRRLSALSMCKRCTRHHHSHPALARHPAPPRTVTISCSNYLADLRAFCRRLFRPSRLTTDSVSVDFNPEFTGPFERVFPLGKKVPEQFNENAHDGWTVTTDADGCEVRAAAAAAALTAEVWEARCMWPLVQAVARCLPCQRSNY
jgi:hypothetical protein